MEQTTLVRFTTLLVSLLLIGVPVSDSCSCGPEEPDPLVFIPIEDLNTSGFNTWDFRSTISGPATDLKKSNLQEWGEYFSAHERDVESIIFDSHLYQLEEIRNNVRSGKPLPSFWAKNPVALFWKENPDDESLDYAVFAKRCEFHATYDPWMQGERERDPVEMRGLIEEGLRLHAQSRSQMMQLRYAYQVVRMAHYAGMFEESVDYYNKLVLNNKTESVIRYYAMSQKAGAGVGILKKPQGDKYNRADIIRDFAAAYHNCPSCPLLSYYDMDFFKAADFFDAAKASENAGEKVGIWFMAAFRQVPLHIAIEKIYEVSPASPELEILLSRLLFNKQAEYAGKITFCANAATAPNTVSSDAELTQGIAVLEKIAAKGNTARPALWSLGAGYLNSIGGECAKAEGLYQNCRRQLAEKADHKIGSALGYLTIVLNSSKLKKYDSINDAFLVELLDAVMKSDNPNVKSYGLMRLRHFFKINDLERNGWLVVSALNRVGHDAYYYYRDDEFFTNFLTLGNIDGMIAESKRTPKSRLEETLWKYSGLNELVLLDYKATLLFHAHKFKESLAIINKIKATDEDLHGDPFKTRIKDCYHCKEDPRYTGPVTSRNEFIKKMAELEDSMKVAGSMQAYYHLKYANGLYSMTFYGRERDIITWNLSPEGGVPSAHWEYHWLNPGNTLSEEGALSKKVYSNLIPRFYYDNREAMGYYLKAAVLSNDKEFKAQCIFMAAKCEQNEYYNRGGHDYDSDDYGTPNQDNLKMMQAKNGWYRTQFKKLKSDYADTEFAKEAIQECSYFRHYMQKE